jgi:oligosaccharide 4-alpha-D-glucosyltransferase
VVGADAIHNVYGHQWAKMVYENQLALNHSLNKKQRPFILMRSGFAGSQRYGMVPWTGDVSRSWGGLKPQVELSLQMSLLGMAYTHSDLGGFAGGETFDQEMYIRWLQYGVFQPIYRPHAQDNIAPEVVFHDKQTQDILRKFIKLRYQLLPYNYSLMYQNSLTGMPLMRPMFFEDESDLSLIDNASSYFWGEDFLVTPIVEPNQKSVQINLPDGVWFDYFSEQRYQGKQRLKLPTKLTTLPVLVRAGAFIPMINNIQSTQDYDSSTLALHYYADSSVTSSQREMYEDDGKSAQTLSSGQYEQLVFSAQQQVIDNKIDQLTIKLKRQGKGYQGMPKIRKMTLVIHNWQQQPNEISLNGKKIKPSQWHKKNNLLEVNFAWSEQNVVININ